MTGATNTGTLPPFLSISQSCDRTITLRTRPLPRKLPMPLLSGFQGDVSHESPPPFRVTPRLSATNGAAAVPTRTRASKSPCDSSGLSAPSQQSVTDQTMMGGSREISWSGRRGTEAIAASSRLQYPSGTISELSPCRDDVLAASETTISTSATPSGIDGSSSATVVAIVQSTITGFTDDHWPRRTFLVSTACDVLLIGRIMPPSIQAPGVYSSNWFMISPRYP